MRAGHVLIRETPACRLAASVQKGMPACLRRPLLRYSIPLNHASLPATTTRRSLQRQPQARQGAGGPGRAREGQVSSGSSSSCCGSGSARQLAALGQSKAAPSSELAGQLRSRRTGWRGAGPAQPSAAALMIDWEAWRAAAGPLVENMAGQGSACSLRCLPERRKRAAGPRSECAAASPLLFLRVS